MIRLSSRSWESAVAAFSRRLWLSGGLEGGADVIARLMRQFDAKCDRKTRPAPVFSAVR